MSTAEFALKPGFFPVTAATGRQNVFSKLLPLYEKAIDKISEKFTYLYSSAASSFTQLSNMPFFKAMNSSDMFPKKDKESRKSAYNERKAKEPKGESQPRIDIFRFLILDDFSTFVYTDENELRNKINDLTKVSFGNLPIGLSFTPYSGPVNLRENVCFVNKPLIKRYVSDTIGDDIEAVNACTNMTAYHENIHQYGIFRNIKHYDSNGNVSELSASWLNDGFVELTAMHVFKKIHGSKYDQAIERMDSAGLTSYSNYVRIIEALSEIVGYNYLADQFTLAPKKGEYASPALNTIEVKQKLNSILASSGDYVFELASDIVSSTNKLRKEDAIRKTDELVAYLHDLRDYRYGIKHMFAPNADGIFF